MREKQVEKALVRKIKDAGGVAVKISAPGLDGMPDRLILMPGGRAWFVETKAPGRKLEALQKFRKRELEEMGFKVSVLDTHSKVNTFVQEVVG